MVRIEGTTLDGPLVGKHVSPEKFAQCLPEGVCLADFVLAMDLAGTPQLGWWGEWRQAALGDMYLRPDLTTETPVPDVPGVVSYLGTFAAVDGTPIPVCPRSLLQRQQARLATLGYEAKTAFELEFFVVEESLREAHEQKFKGLTPLGGDAHKMAYLTQRSSQFLPILRSATERLEAMGIPWEAFNDEAAPGQFELNLAPADPVTTADRTVRAKRALRDAAYEHGHAVTFMARPFPIYGSGLHLHLSLWRDGSPAFAEGDLIRHWVAGSLATATGATSIYTPTINSFRRQVDFAAVPTTPTWGEENKGAAFRTITRSGALARVEHRIASADANPYLVLATVLAGGMAGLEEKLEPPAPVAHLPWGLPEGYARLPTSITAAAEALAADTRLRAALGDEFVDHWVESRKWEWLMFHSEGGDPDAAAVTDWELQRYFEWV
ncbi:MAG TPA: glutamine synthetase family protein [Acidimicrobiales bacterium]|nr:glutamine synthetase family protein [Acidimicrobiales bacterium]